MKRILTLAAACSACATFVGPQPPERRVFTPPAETPAAPPSSPGSLWHGPRRGDLFSGAALAPGDVLVVRVVEVAEARRAASTELDRNSLQDVALSAEAGTNALGPLSANAGFTNNFAGAGRSDRSDRLVATVPAVVREVLPSGALFVEGRRKVVLHGEVQVLYVSGVADLRDIEPDRSIASSRLAEAEVHLAAEGPGADKQRPGWLARILDWIWPL